MSAQENSQIVKDFFAAIGSGDKQRLLSMVAEDIEWIIPGEDWPLAGTRCCRRAVFGREGHAHAWSDLASHARRLAEYGPRLAGLSAAYD